MSSKTGRFQEGFSVGALRCAAIALIAIASPAYAETLNLYCEYDKGGSNEFLIDLDQKTMQFAANSQSLSRAEVTERSINWKTTATRMDGAGGAHISRIEISIDRVAGSILLTEISDRGAYSALAGKCRRATKKF